MKRLAVIGIRGFPGVQGGVESHCQQLIPRLAEKMDCTVYRRKPYLTEASAESIRGIRFIDLPSTRIKGFETLVHTFISCLHLLFHRVDIVNVHNIGPGLFIPLLRLYGYKVILTYHSPNYEHAKWGVMSKLLLRLCEKIALRCANHIIFVSPVQRNKYNAKILRKSSAIPNGITRLPAHTGTEFLEKHGIKAGEYLLAVGRLTPEKGFEYLIQAANESPHVKQLVIAGASDHDPHYITRLKDFDIHGKTVFTGFTTGSDLSQLYHHAKLYVLSSLNEGFPMVLLEAMSNNLPIVSTDIPAAHIIELPPEHYAARANANALADAINRILQSGPTDCTYQIDDYDWDRIARHTESIYGQVLHPHDDRP